MQKKVKFKEKENATNAQSTKCENVKTQNAKYIYIYILDISRMPKKKNAKVQKNAKQYKTHTKDSEKMKKIKNKCEKNPIPA